MTASPSDERRIVGFAPEDKEAVLEALINTRRHAQHAEISLRFQSRTAEADQIAAWNAKLSEEIDVLVDRMMDDWLGSAGGIVPRLTLANIQLEGAAAEIKRRVAVTQQVVDVIGILDGVLAAAVML